MGRSSRYFLAAGSRFKGELRMYGAEAHGRGGCNPSDLRKADRPRGPPQPNGCSRLQNGPSAPNNAPKLQVCRRRAVLQKSENTQETVHEGVCCPECGSAKVWRDGLRYTSGGAVQRYLCRSCGYRFSETQVKLNVFSKLPKRSKVIFEPSNVNSPSLGSIKESSDNASFTLREDVGSHGRSPLILIARKNLSNSIPIIRIAEYATGKTHRKTRPPRLGEDWKVSAQLKSGLRGPQSASLARF